MADNKSHMSERVKEDSEKLTPEKRARLMAAADRDPSWRSPGQGVQGGRQVIGTSATPVPKAIHRLGPGGTNKPL
jgi:hypothetical protein